MRKTHLPPVLTPILNFSHPIQHLSIEALIGNLPVGGAVAKGKDGDWQYWLNGRLISGSFSLRTLLEMEFDNK